MTTTLEQPHFDETALKTIEKVSIVISKGSLEGIYPGLIMANGARMDGIEADLFFTFFGLDAIRKDRYEKIKVATVGNPGMHMPTLLGALPGFSALATKMMQRQMEKIDIPPVPEFIELVADSGVQLRARGRTPRVATRLLAKGTPARAAHKSHSAPRTDRRAHLLWPVSRFTKLPRRFARRLRWLWPARAPAALNRCESRDPSEPRIRAAPRRTRPRAPGASAARAIAASASGPRTDGVRCRDCGARDHAGRVSDAAADRLARLETF